MQWQRKMLTRLAAKTTVSYSQDERHQPPWQGDTSVVLMTHCLA